MLRKRTRSHQKDQQMGHPTMSDSGSESYFQPDVLGHNHKSNSFFSVSGVFVGLSPKGLLDSDSIRSPTSPLDIRVFSNLGNNSSRSPRSPHKNWDSNKVGLSIIECLDDDMKASGKVLRSSESKNILFGPRMRIKTPNHETHINSFEAPKSLPKSFAIFGHTHIKSPLHKGSSDVIFEIGETPLEPEPFGKIRSCSLDSCRSFSVLSGLADRSPNLSSGNFCVDNITTQVSSPPQFIGGTPNSNNFLPTGLNSISVSDESGNGFIDTLSASEIELSEDYTCVISHGPNPKTTHIFGDCILGCHSSDSSNFGKNEGKEFELPQAVTCTAALYPSGDFLSFCYSCNKKLEGEDIYIYRGEKAFCSLNCRSQEILIDEEMEKSINKPSENSPKADHGEELFEAGILVAT